MTTTEMACSPCCIAVRGAFPVDRLGGLPVEHQRFIEMFVLASGNLKQLAAVTGVSYPTVRSRLDKVIVALRDAIGREAPTEGTLLDAVARPAGLGAPPACEHESAATSAERLIKSI